MRYKKGSDESLEDLLVSELHPLINGQCAIAPRIILLEDGLVLALNNNLQFNPNKEISLPRPE